MINTPEKQLELAYAACLTACEPTLADTPLRLTSLILAQMPTPGSAEYVPEFDEEGIEKLPVPRVTLTAKAGQENPAGTTIRETELLIEAVDNAQSASADGGRLDALFRAAAHPLWYKNVTVVGVATKFADYLSSLVPSFRCYGINTDTIEGDTEYEGATVRRWIKATFLCQNVETTYVPAN